MDYRNQPYFVAALFAAFAFLGQTSMARLHESLEQCIERYGPPTKQFPGTKPFGIWDEINLKQTQLIPNCEIYYFEKPIKLEPPKQIHVDIKVVLLDGVVEQIHYETPRSFSDQIINDFLSVNGWVGSKDNKKGNPSLSATANSGDVWVTTRKFEEAEQNSKKLGAGTEKQGF